MALGANPSGKAENGNRPDGQRQAQPQATHRRRCLGHSSGDLGQRREPARLQEVREVRSARFVDRWC